MDKPFQRKGSQSNAHVGRDFEIAVREFFAKEGMELSPSVSVLIGVADKKKKHSFDLGSEKDKILVECKAHRWTEGDKVPSAKLTVWNEAMLYFHVSPSEYRRVLVVLRDYSQSRGETLGAYYVRTYPHLIPKNVEIWEYDEHERTGVRVK